MKCPYCQSEVKQAENNPNLFYCPNPDCLNIRKRKAEQFDGRYEREYFKGGGYLNYDYVGSEIYERRAKKLVDITNPISVLDVGCAYGYIVKCLHELGIPAMGCDISKYAQRKARKIIPHSFCLCPTWDLKFADKSFDVIYCEGVLEHIPEDKVEQTFQEFQRVANRFYLQISFKEHRNVELELGHICLQSIDWWAERMPPHSWLAYNECSTDNCLFWVYKG